jgi:ubiquitin C-terminal hydrolase
MHASKLKHHVDFGETLDLGPFMKRERLQQQQQQQQHMYELCGVVVHDGGSVRSGHYFRRACDAVTILNDCRRHQKAKTNSTHHHTR